MFYYPAEDASPKKLYSVGIAAEDVPKVLADDLYKLSTTPETNSIIFEILISF